MVALDEFDSRQQRKDRRKFFRQKYKTGSHLKNMEMPGIEPGAFHMRSERSTTELHPRPKIQCQFLFIYSSRSVK